MTHFPADISFRATWRPYQQRVLSELDQHLLDGRLHVIAAPGSGKTLLGLEVVVRLGKPTLVLAPTLTIRNQWVRRFEEMFLPDGSALPGWVSTNLRRPGLLTVATYQALHCACAGTSCDETAPEPEEENGGDDSNGNGDSEKTETAVEAAESPAATLLRNAGIQTIVVDEAHHLRAEWWKSLTQTVRGLEEPSIIALTATPPYDVSGLEWQRYKELCGAVDAEISAPELVLAGNLCPHQDYIYLNLPSKEENARLAQFRADVESLRQDICSNEEFVAAIESHPWLNFPRRHIEEILADPEYFASIAVFVNAVRGRVPEDLPAIMGATRETIPPLDLRWLEILLTGRLYTDATLIGEWDPMLKLIRERLSRIGATERRKVYLRATPRLDRMLVTSVKKLDSVFEIAKIEHGAMGQDLRMVILTDFIRASEMPDSPIDIKPLNRIGVVPIFERIRRECPPGAKLGILSGSLVVVPTSSEQALRKLCSAEGIEDSQVNLHPLFHDPSYCRLVIERDVNKVVELVTKLFCDGAITVLVGTKSLLGEGWDAPAVNSLILASFVGSYMLSNQMRGRAVRSLPGDPEKTANVWHLVCVEPAMPGSGADIETLRRRFKAFVGVSFDGRTIENGIRRMGMDGIKLDQAAVDSINAEMRRLAVDRRSLRQRWSEALVVGGTGRMVGEVNAPKRSVPRRFVVARASTAALRGLLAGAIAAVVSAAGGSVAGVELAASFPYDLMIGGLMAAPFMFTSVWLTAEPSPEEKAMKRVARALLEAMRNTGQIGKPVSELKLTTKTEPDLTISCALEGATSHESSLFLDSLEEILSPVENPRYLIARVGMGSHAGVDDYYAVPEILARQKACAKHFLDAWNRYVGAGELIYTRTIDGRESLLRARGSLLSVTTQRESRRTSCWR